MNQVNAKPSQPSAKEKDASQDTTTPPAEEESKQKDPTTSSHKASPEKPTPPPSTGPLLKMVNESIPDEGQRVGQISLERASNSSEDEAEANKCTLLKHFFHL